MADVLDKQTIKALSVEARQDMVKMLAKRPYTASELSKLIGKHVTTVTEHLDVLESSGLVKKKDSTNKWVYYELTPKGERLFKPQLYSWIVVLSLSAVLLFSGILRIFNSQMAAGGASIAQESAPLMAKTADAMYYAPAPVVDYLAFALIGLGLFGICYVAYRKYAIK